MSETSTIRTRSVAKVPGRTISKKSAAPFFNKIIQPKLTIGQVDDPYEREADAVADKVMRMTDKEVLQTNPAPVSIQKKCAACEEEEKLNRMEDEDEHVQLKPIADIPIQKKCAACEEEEKIQMKCAACEEEEEHVSRKEINEKPTLQVQLKPAAPEIIVQKKCAHCEEEERLNRKEEDEEHVQMKPIAAIPIQRKCAACEQEEIHRKESGNNSTPVVSDSVYQTIGSRGNPLDHSTRSFMESRFNYDFSGVQIHDDALAHRSSKDIKARAYTNGKHIVFGSGQYQPNTFAGKQLLAHELTHVVQQGKSLKGVQHLQRDTAVGLNMSGKPGGKKTFDIRGKSKIRFGKDFSDYLMFFFQLGMNAPIEISYGNQGIGTVYIKPRLLVFPWGCKLKSIGIPLDLVMVKECAFYFDAALSLFDADAQLIPFTLPELDTSSKNGTLALKVEINSNDIVSNEINPGDTNRALAWVPGVTKDNLNGIYDYHRADFRQEAFLPFIYGKDYNGKNFKSVADTNHMSGGYLIFNAGGELALPNQQTMDGGIQLGDTGRNGWNVDLSANIMGAEHSKVPIKRTRKGDLYGSDDQLK